MGIWCTTSRLAPKVLIGVDCNWATNWSGDKSRAGPPIFAKQRETGYKRYRKPLKVCYSTRSKLSLGASSFLVWGSLGTGHSSGDTLASLCLRGQGPVVLVPHRLLEASPDLELNLETVS